MTGGGDSRIPPPTYHVGYTCVPYALPAVCAAGSRVDVCMSSNRRMGVHGHDAHNTKRLVVKAARPGFVDTRFQIAAENCTMTF